MASRRNRRSIRHSEADEDDEGPDRGPGVPEVDLHGCTVEAAQRRLAQALARWRAGGVRRARVVTGAGHGSLAGRARLLPAVQAWLRGAEGTSYGVREVRTLPGGGALEVTLARR